MMAIDVQAGKNRVSSSRSTDDKTLKNIKESADDQICKHTDQLNCLEHKDALNVYRTIQIPNLKDKKEKFTSNEVSIVVHPLFESLFFGKNFNNDEWKNTPTNPLFKEGKNRGELYIEKMLVTEMNRVIRDTPKGKISDSYFRLYEIYEDYLAFKKSLTSPTPVILVLPGNPKNSSHLPASRAYEPLIDIINGYANSHIFYIESADWGNGHLDSATVSNLGRALPQEANIKIAGGYIGRCMKDFYDAIKPILNPKQKVVGDISDSTPLLEFFDGTILDPKVMNLPPFTPNSKTELTSFEEVENIIEANADLNRSYKKYSVDFMKNDTGDYAMGIPWQE